MAGPRDLIDTSGDTPSLRLKKWVASLIGIVSFGWITGTINLVTNWGGGVNDAIRSVGDYFTQVIGGGGFNVITGPRIGIFDIAGSAIGLAFRMNARFIADTFGGFAQIAAIIEIMLLGWIILVGLERIVGSVIPS